MAIQSRSVIAFMLLVLSNIYYLRTTWVLTGTPSGHSPEKETSVIIIMHIYVYTHVYIYIYI